MIVTQATLGQWLDSKSNGRPLEGPVLAGLAAVHVDVSSIVHLALLLHHSLRPPLLAVCASETLYCLGHLARKLSLELVHQRDKHKKQVVKIVTL